MSRKKQVEKEQLKSSATSGKRQALDAAISVIEKQFGVGSIMKMGERKNLDVSTVPTGSITLDLALGVGGVPRGRIVEIFGPEASGKTSLALSIVGEAQKVGGLCAFVDAEHAFDPDYSKKLGVDVDQLLISQPDTGEQALEITETLIRSNALDVIVIDSVAALVPRAEIEGEMGDSMMGLQARLMSQALRKITGAVSKSKTVVIFINQLRMKIGVMFGNPETTTGGMALKFYSSIRLDVRRIEQLKRGDVPVGNRVRVKVVKNKVAPPFKTAEFEMLYGQGVSKSGEAIDLGIKYGIITKAGAWLTFSDPESLKLESDKIGQGREAARTFLDQNPKILDKLIDEIKSRVEAEESAA
jgi:recombination protein RecA